LDSDDNFKTHEILGPTYSTALLPCAGKMDLILCSVPERADHRWEHANMIRRLLQSTETK